MVQDSLWLLYVGFGTTGENEVVAGNPIKIMQAYSWQSIVACSHNFIEEKRKVLE
jgi:hypothetical protein